MKKKMISIRVEPKLLELLDRVSKTPNTKYSDKDRTWLIEHAIESQYEIFAKNGNKQA